MCITLYRVISDYSFLDNLKGKFTEKSHKMNEFFSDKINQNGKLII